MDGQPRQFLLVLGWKEGVHGCNTKCQTSVSNRPGARCHTYPPVPSAWPTSLSIPSLAPPPLPHLLWRSCFMSLSFYKSSQGPNRFGSSILLAVMPVEFAPCPLLLSNSHFFDCTDGPVSWDDDFLLDLLEMSEDDSAVDVRVSTLTNSLVGTPIASPRASSPARERP